jgi:hypothetical protein
MTNDSGKLINTPHGLEFSLVERKRSIGLELNELSSSGFK